MELPLPKVHYQQIISGLSLRPKVGFFGYSSVTLIRDGSENILFDTGAYGVRAELLETLKDTHIHKVFLSHLHFDHCANVSLFKNAEVYVHEKELNDLNKENALYEDINIHIANILKNVKLVTFSQEKHLTENTKIILTPGHTLGHSSLEILSQKKRTIVAGDAIETYQEYLGGDYSSSASEKHSYTHSKEHIKTTYRTIIPGHSSIIEDGLLQDTNFCLKMF